MISWRGTLGPLNSARVKIIMISNSEIIFIQIDYRIWENARVVRTPNTRTNL